MRAGILIVGGGPMGAWLALEATRYADPLGAPVVLVDEGDPAAAHGPLVVFGDGLHGDLSESLAPQLRDGAHALFNFEPQTGRPIGYCRTGALVSAGALPSDGLTEEQLREVERQARGLVLEQPNQARYLANVALVDAVRCHLEVLALARTRGAITRPGTRVTAIRRDGSRVVGVDTDRGTIDAQVVVLTSTRATRQLLPTYAADLREVPWCQASFPSPLIHAEGGGGLELPPGGIAELSGNPAALDALFSAGGELESPHPAVLEATGALIAPNPIAGNLVLVDREDPTPLAARAPLHGDLGQPTITRGTTHVAPDGLPLVGEVEPDLFLAIALGPMAQVLAPGLAPGLAAGANRHPIAAYDPAKLAPDRT
ncbi:MAG: FAD-dependent oxidoreductase [Planctomycetota bacterium]|nr:FAD-dependent oxidoreductase [Planctomycetota bacterium]